MQDSIYTNLWPFLQDQYRISPYVSSLQQHHSLMAVSFLHQFLSPLQEDENVLDINPYYF